MMNCLRIENVMCVMSKNPCLSLYSFCPLSCFSHSIKPMTLRGSVEIRKVEGIFGKFTAHPNKGVSSVIITVHYLSQASRHSRLPEEIGVRRLIKFIDIDRSQRVCCKTNSNILIYKNVNDQYINL